MVEQSLIAVFHTVAKTYHEVCLVAAYHEVAVGQCACQLLFCDDVGVTVFFCEDISEVTVVCLLECYGVGVCLALVCGGVFTCFLDVFNV